MTSSLEAMEAEIRNQVEDLPNFLSRLRRDGVPSVDPATTIFVGSGDSYACALYVARLSGSSVIAEDPHELSRSLALAKGKDVVIVSISGRTRANIKLARRLKRFARKTVGVTSKAHSPLAKACNDTILLRYRSGGTLTSGTASFTTSLLACCYLVSKVPDRLRLDNRLKEAARWARAIHTSATGSLVFVGSGIFSALAEYGVCKVAEVLGQKAYSQFPEQLGHAQLFSLNAIRDTLVFLGVNRDRKTHEVFKALTKNGLRTYPIGVSHENLIVDSLITCFHIQYLVLTIAKARRMKECAFLADKAKLQLSNRLIY